jgi:hypothetical protein
MPPCRHACVPACHCTTMPSCHHAWLPLYCHATMPACRHACMRPCLVATLPVCHHATVSSCLHATVPPCLHATVPPCHLATMPACRHACMPPCHHAIMPACHRATHGSTETCAAQVFRPCWVTTRIMQLGEGALLRVLAKQSCNISLVDCRVKQQTALLVCCPTHPLHSVVTMRADVEPTSAGLEGLTNFELLKCNLFVWLNKS